MTAQDFDVLPSAYNAFEEAFKQGIKVAIVHLNNQDWNWSHRDRGILVSKALDHRARNEAVAHCIAHFDLSSSRKGQEALKWVGWRGRLEMDIHSMVAGRMISLPALSDAISLSEDFVDVAACLGVSEFLLSWRLQYLTDDEIGELPVHALNRLQWGPSHDTVVPTGCGWPPPGTGDMYLQIAKHQL
ncbi:hypothetical protein [Nocardia sp. NPDC058666]|uniref:hypothetical protein n=1 Tax=Nocardia sp. NPDC058666 TaxID=3346587 RepID=UPI00364626C0